MAQKTSTATGDKKLSAKAAGGGAPPADAGAAFRQAMSRIAAPVYIVATDGPAGLAGLTATAVASVSDAPPILLVCVNRSLSSASRFIENGVFSVNALTGEDRALADHFAGQTGLRLEGRFDHGRWEKRLTGAPTLASALAVFDCRLSEVKEVGSHYIFFGAVAEASVPREGEGLLYCRREYKKL